MFEFLRRGFAPALLLSLVTTLSGCPKPAAKPTVKGKVPPAVEAPKAYLLLVSHQVRDAEVYVDGKRVAGLAEATAAPGLALSPGVHRVEIRAQGYRPFRLELKLVADKTERLKVELMRQ